MAENIINLSLYESRAVVPLETRAAGVYEQKLAVAGNSILSSVYVQSLDPGATVKVDYSDFGVGGDAGEEYALDSHPLMSTAGETSRILVTKIHNKPKITMTVTGGSVRFGIYNTVVASFASDLDSALKAENEIANLSADKGMPIIVYDSQAGLYKFARGLAGIQDVRIVGNVNIGDPGTPLFLDYQGTPNRGSLETLITYTVPVSQTLNLSRLIVSSRSEASFQLTANGVIIGSGRTSPAQPIGIFPWQPSRPVASNALIEVKYETRLNSPLQSVEAYVQGTLS